MRWHDRQQARGRRRREQRLALPPAPAAERARAADCPIAPGAPLDSHLPISLRLPVGCRSSLPRRALRAPPALLLPNPACPEADAVGSIKGAGGRRPGGFKRRHRSNGTARRSSWLVGMGSAAGRRPGSQTNQARRYQKGCRPFGLPPRSRSVSRRNGCAAPGALHARAHHLQDRDGQTTESMRAPSNLQRDWVQRRRVCSCRDPPPAAPAAACAAARGCRRLAVPSASGWCRIAYTRGGGQRPGARAFRRPGAVRGGIGKRCGGGCHGSGGGEARGRVKSERVSPSAGLRYSRERCQQKGEALVLVRSACGSAVLRGGRRRRGGAGVREPRMPK